MLVGGRGFLVSHIIIPSCSMHLPANWSLLAKIRTRLRKLFNKVADTLKDDWWTAGHWKFIRRQPSKQTNWVDCGIFVTTWAIMEIVGLPLNAVTQGHCKVALRTRFRFALLTKEARGEGSHYSPFNMVRAGFVESATKA